MRMYYKFVMDMLNLKKKIVKLEGENHVIQMQLFKIGMSFGLSQKQIIILVVCQSSFLSARTDGLVRLSSMHYPLVSQTNGPSNIIVSGAQVLLLVVVTRLCLTNYFGNPCAVLYVLECVVCKQDVTVLHGTILIQSMSVPRIQKSMYLHGL